MKNAKVMSAKRSFFMSVLSLILCFAMLLGSTYAWFTDEVTSGVNQIKAGNLDVELLHQSKNDTNATSVSGETTLFDDVALWEPGAYAYETFTIKNVGNLAFKYSMVINAVNAIVVDGHSLDEVLKVKVVDTAPANRPAYTDGADLKTWSYTSGSTPLYPVGNADNKPSEKTFTVVVYWEPTDNDNQWNMNNGNKGKTLSVDLGISLVATQLPYEADSFDNQYDAMAEFPVVAETEVEENKETVLTAYDVNNTLAAKATIPADTDLPEGTAKIMMTVDEVGTPPQVTLEEDEEALNLDVKFFSVKSDGTKTQITDFGTQIVEVDLSAQIPDNHDLVKVFHTHSGTVSEMTKASSKEAVADGNYYYDGATKMLTIGSKKFSPFTFVIKEAAYEVIAEKEGETPVGMSLAQFRDSVNDGNDYAGWTATLQKDIDLAGVENWGMIGTDDNKFAGIFDGNNKTISNLSITNNDGYAAMFYSIADGAQIKNLKFTNVSISAKYACVLLGDAEKTQNFKISNVEVASGTIDGSRYGSGIVFDIEGSGVEIDNCINRVNISSVFAGGIVAYATGCTGMSIQNCVNYGNITGQDNAGGIIGQSTGTTYTNCRNYGTISASEGTWGQAYAGGIVASGQNNTTITYCSNFGDVQATQGDGGEYKGFAGGINGCSNGSQTIEFCINTGNVTSNGRAGGITGDTNGGVSPSSQCYNAGTITSTVVVAGGIAGRNNSTTNINKCLNAGTVVQGSAAYSIAEKYGTQDYYYDGATLKTAAGIEAAANDALTALNAGLDTPFWGIDSTDGMIKPISLISAD